MQVQQKILTNWLEVEKATANYLNGDVQIKPKPEYRTEKFYFNPHDVKTMAINHKNNEIHVTMYDGKEHILIYNYGLEVIIGNIINSRDPLVVYDRPKNSEN